MLGVKNSMRKGPLFSNPPKDLPQIPGAIP